MKLAAYSDLHVEFAPFAPPRIDADVVVLAGDILCPGSQAVRWMSDPALFDGRPIVYVPGNHEYYGQELWSEELGMQVEAEQVREQGVHLLQCGETVIQGVRFLGCTLWTDFELRLPRPDGTIGPRVEEGMRACASWLNDYSAIRVGSARKERRLSPDDTLEIHRSHRAWLEQKLAEPFAGPTVVVTHHAPHRGSLSSRFSRDRVSTGFVSELPESFFEVPALWVHGHTHVSFDYRVGNCRVLCNPRGYPISGRKRFENRGFNPWLLIELA